MDNFMENPWFVRIIALLLAAFLFISANDFGGRDGRSNPNDMENDDTDIIENVPVEIYYDSENLVVTGVPKTVNVQVQGQRRFVEAAKRQRDFTVYVDLSNTEIGRHRVPILARDISEKLKVTIQPAYAEISLQEKVTVDARVEAEFNRSILAEGFEAEQPEVEPKVVKVTGAKDVVEKITYVKATIDASGLINDTIKRQAPVTVLDRELNKLDVVVEPSTVSVTIPVTNPRKNVSVKINQVGTPPEDINITTVSTTTPEVLIFGRTEVLKDIEEIEVNVDVSNIVEDSEIEVPLELPQGVNKITPETIKVNITAEKKKYEETLDDLVIQHEGIGSGLTFSFLSPNNGRVSLKVTGYREELEDLDKSQFQVMLNLEGLNPGVHEVPIQVQGPENVEWELSEKSARVRITD